MSESVETKQQYLRTEIIDQGYDAEDFSNYMATVRGENSLDLELWTFSDLQAVVKLYKSLMAKKQQNQQSIEKKDEQNKEVQNREQEAKNINENDNNNNNSKKNPEENIENSATKDNSVPEKREENHIYTFPNEPFEEFDQIIKTQKLEKNEITDQNNLYVTVTNPTKVNKGIFSHYEYIVQTNPVGYNVVRKASDFTFLYENLPKFNSEVFNPILPHFEIGLKDDSPKKLLYFKNYINSLVENKFFRTLPIIYEFLTLPKDQWKLKKENYSKLKPYSLSLMQTLEGEFHIRINKNDDEKVHKIKEEIKKREEAYDNFNNAMDELLTVIEKMSICYQSVAKSLYDLVKTHQDNNKPLSDLFNRLLNLNKIWAVDCNKQKDFLRDEVKYFFKFMNKENISFLKKYEEFKDAKEDYRNKYEKVKKQPNKNQKDLDNVQKLRRDYGIKLIIINNEYQQLIERQANRSLTQFLKYNDNKNVILQNYNNCEKLFNINEDPNSLIKGGEKEEKHEKGEDQNQNNNNKKEEEKISN